MALLSCRPHNDADQGPDVRVQGLFPCSTDCGGYVDRCTKVGGKQSQESASVFGQAKVSLVARLVFC